MLQDRCIQLLEQGYSKREIATMLRMGYSTVRLYTKGHPSDLTRRRYCCKHCGIRGTKYFYKDSLHHCKACWVEKVKSTKQLRMARYMSQRGQCSCSLCGYDRYTSALEWHHPQGEDPRWVPGWTWDQYCATLSACVVVCANCHRHLHAQGLTPV